VEINITVQRPAFLTGYYAGGGWHEVEGWDERERQGLPPLLVWAIERDGKTYVPKDVEAGPVHDHCGFLTGHADSNPSFEQLHELAAHLRSAGTYDREVLVFYGGRHPLHNALMTVADRGLIMPFSPSSAENLADDLRKRFDPDACALDTRNVILTWTG